MAMTANFRRTVGAVAICLAISALNALAAPSLDPVPEVKGEIVVGAIADPAEWYPYQTNRDG